MKLKLNRIKTITDIADSNITILGDYFLSRIRDIDIIKMRNVISYWFSVFKRTKYKRINKCMFFGIKTNKTNYTWNSKSMVMDYGIYYGLIHKLN